MGLSDELKEMVLAPIALFVFNRPLHTARTLEALQANEFAEQSDLFIFCDASRHEDEAESVQMVRTQVRGVTGFKTVTIVERDENFGLSKSIVETVSILCEEFGKVIVLEDDLETSPDFLRYMNQGLNLYESDERVASIHGYSYPIQDADIPESYFLRGADCWGWGTWARAWRCFESDGKKLLVRLQEERLESRFNYEGCAPYVRMLKNRVQNKNQSWAILWHASAFLENMLTLYPRQSLVSNFGFDDTGVHCRAVDYFQVNIGLAPAKLSRIRTVEDERMRLKVADFFRRVRKQRWIDFLRSPIQISVRQAKRVIKANRFLR